MRARTVVVSLVATLAAALLVAIGAPTASAATGTITVTPNTGLSSGDVVTLSGQGFAPSALIATCEGRFDGTPGIEDCGGSAETFTSAADGSFSRQITVRRFLTVGGTPLDCASPGASCGIGAAEYNDIAGTAVAVPISFAPATGHPRPDLGVKRRDTQQLLYDGEYFPTVSAAPARRHALAADGTWTYALVVQNDGDVPDDLVLTEPTPPVAPFSTRFFYGYYDLTAAVAGSGLVFHDVAPGQSFTIAVNISGVGAPDDASSLTGIGVHSGSAPELVDFVRLGVTTPMTS
jgi:hypothetical protein